MQCGSLSDDDEDDDYHSNDKKPEDCNNVDKEKANNNKNDNRKSASKAGSFNPAESCELCHIPSGMKDGKPSPWMWSRSTSFRSPDNPF